MNKIATQLDAVINLRDNFSKTLEGIDQKMRDFQRTAQRTGRDVWKSGKKMEKTGQTLTKGLTAPIVGVGLAAGKMSMDFNESLANIGTMIPGQTKRLEELKGGIQDVAITTAKGTDEIAEGVYSVISAYGDAEDTMEKVELNAKAGTAGLATTNDALNLSSALMKGYGDTSAESNEKVLDLAFTTLKLGQTTFPELASSMGKVVPTSNELGISQEELFAVFATGTGVTGNASEVSTQYQGVLKALMSPTKDMSKLIADMGYEDGKAMVAKQGLGDTIETIVEVSKKTGKPLSKYIGSIQGQVIALALAGEQSDVYDEKLHELMNSTGALDTAFAEQAEGINKTGFSFKQSMIRMQVAGQKLGDSLAPVIDKLADAFERVSEKLSNLTPQQLDTAVEFAKIAAAIGPVLLIIGKLTTGVAKGIFVFSDFAKKANQMGGVLKAIMSPGNMVVLTFMALIAAGILIYKNWDKIQAKAEEIFPGIGAKATEAFGNMSGAIKRLVDTALPILQNALEIMKSAIKVSLEFILDFWNEHGESILALITSMWEFIEATFTFAMSTIRWVISTGIEFMQNLWSLFGDTIISSAETAWETISTLIGAFIDIISGILDIGTGLISLNWEKAWEGIKKTFGGIFKGIIGIAKGGVNGIINIINGMIGGLNKISLPDWVPGLGGKGINIPLIPKLAKGTNNWSGGIAQVHERGGEIIDLPDRSRVYPHDKSVSMAREQGRREGSKGGVVITGNAFHVRKESDIDAIASALVRKMKRANINMA